MRAGRADDDIIAMTCSTNVQTLQFEANHAKRTTGFAHDARLFDGGEPSPSSRSRFAAPALFSLRDDGEPGGARGATCACACTFVNVFSESGVESLSKRPLALCTRESVRFFRGGLAGHGGVGRPASVSVSDASGSGVSVAGPGIPFRMAL